MILQLLDIGFAYFGVALPYVLLWTIWKINWCVETFKFFYDVNDWT